MLETVAALDSAMTGWINAGAGDHLVIDSVMIAATTLGLPLMAGLVAIQWWWEGDEPAQRHLRHVILAVALSCAAGFAINQAILLFVHRARPNEAAPD